MLELLATIIISIFSVLAVAAGTVSQSEKYRKLKSQAEKEVPNYEKILPEYKLVDKIPDEMDREKGVKYFNDAEQMERVKYTDIERIRGGETTITDTPVEEFAGRRFTEMKEDVRRIKENYIKHFRIPEEPADKRASDDVLAKYRDEVHEIFQRQGAFSPNYKKILVSNIAKRPDNEINPHEDTHAYIHQKIMRELGITPQTKRRYLRQLKAHEEKLDDVSSQFLEKGDYSEKAWSELGKINDELAGVRKRIDNINAAKISIPGNSVKTLDEGLSWAVGKHYSGRGPEPKDLEHYKEKDGIKPELLTKSIDVIYRLIQSSPENIDSVKNFVTDTIIEARKENLTDEQAVDLLEKRIKYRENNLKRILR